MSNYGFNKPQYTPKYSIAICCNSNRINTVQYSTIPEGMGCHKLSSSMKYHIHLLWRKRSNSI